MSPFVQCLVTAAYVLHLVTSHTLTDYEIVNIPFDGTLKDYARQLLPIGQNITFGTNRFGLANMAANFSNPASFVSYSAEIMPTQEFSVSYWIKFMQSSRQAIGGWGGNGCGTSFIMTYNNYDQKVCGSDFGVQGHCRVNALNICFPSNNQSQWQHVVVSTSRFGTVIYQNGKRVSADQTNWNGIITNGKLFVLGALPDPTTGSKVYTDSSVGYFTGLMSDFKVYSRTLYQDQVSCLYREQSKHACQETTHCSGYSGGKSDF